MSKNNTERNYWIAVVVLLIVVWFLGSWDFYVCEVRGFCPSEAVASETTDTKTTEIVQSASVINAFGTVEEVEEEVPVAERPVRYYRNY